MDKDDLTFHKRSSGRSEREQRSPAAHFLQADLSVPTGPSRGQRGAVSGDRKKTTYAFVFWRVADNTEVDQFDKH